MKEIIIPVIENGQEDVAYLLERINRKIQYNKRINDNLQQQLKLMYDYWFTQFDFPDENGKPYCSSGGKMIWCEDLKRNIPNGWLATPLSHILSLKPGYAFSSDLYSASGKYKLLTIKNVQDTGVNLDVDNYINRIPENMPTYCLLKNKDILMSLTGNVGRIGLMYADNCLLNQRVALASPTNLDLHTYIYMLLKSDTIRKQYEVLSNGSSQQNLSPIEAEKVMIAYSPQISLLYSKMYTNHVNQIVSNLSENNLLIALRNWLLPMLMNGQATITD